MNGANPVKSTWAAARYLKDLHDYYGRWYLAAAAYNAGPTIVDRALQQSGAKDFWSIKRKSQLSEETRNFVPKFCRHRTDCDGSEEIPV
jgi:peptidoglycan lytic transglycosylase D